MFSATLNEINIVIYIKKMKLFLLPYLVHFLSINSVDAFFSIGLDDYSAYVQEESFKHCVCVPYWLCKEDLSGLDQDGIDKMDIRSKSFDNNSPSACTGDLDVCCKVECGVRGNSEPSDEVNPNNVDARILGENNEANFAEFPWMLGVVKGVRYKCGASLFHPKVALTAAHCVTGSAKYTVRAGEWHWKHTNEPFPHQDRSVEQIVIHPNFHSGSLRNDIALLVLSEPFRLTQNVGIICLPPPKLRVDIRRCVASGWGKNSFIGGTYQPVLKKVHLPIMPRNKCVTVLREAKLGPFFTLHGSFICAGGEDNKDTCKGDGGSPLICPVIGQTERYHQIGIVSWGLTCGIANTPGVYVNVILFSEWIDNEMIKLGLDTDIYRYPNE